MTGRVYRALRKIFQGYYKWKLCRLPVWQEIERFRSQAPFGKRYVHYAKYYILYAAVTKYKPQTVLELGSGLSTLIIGYALKRNKKGVLISMEENQRYGREVMRLVGDVYPVHMHIESACEDVYRGIEGHRYKHVPEHDYDFIFVDGPRTTKVDLDALFVLERAPTARVVIDNRKSTYQALSAILRPAYKTRFNKIINIGYIN